MRNYPTYFLADQRYLKIHDLRHERPVCDIETILHAHQDRPYEDRIIAMALGYCLCPHCNRSIVVEAEKELMEAHSKS